MAETLSKTDLRKAHVTGQHPHCIAGCGMCERKAAKQRQSEAREFHLRLDSLRERRDAANAERLEERFFAYSLMVVANYSTLQATLIEGYDLRMYVGLGYRVVAD